MKIYQNIFLPYGLNCQGDCDCQEEYNSGYTAGYLSGYTAGQADCSGVTPVYSAMPLTFEITSGGTICWKASYRSYPKTIEYSKNGGNWTSITSSTGDTAPTIEVVEGDILEFRGNNPTYSNSYSNYNSFCGSTAEFVAYGNIMSMIDSENFSTLTTLESAYTFYNLFGECTGLTDASNLVLPATTLASNCYSYLFSNCTNLTRVPELPATSLNGYCYQYMFYNCTSLTTAPKLPATSLNGYCYNGMFAGCTSLTTAPELPATTLGVYCYQNMFNGCSSLTVAPDLSRVTNVYAYSCLRMFQGCTSLVNPPLSFGNSATTLGQACCAYMFSGCTSLTTAPELPATTLVPYCYESMFHGCSSLNYIKCLATDISAAGCTFTWVSGVASAGTFVKDADMNDWTTGTSGIPIGWTVQDAECSGCSQEELDEAYESGFTQGYQSGYTEGEETGRDLLISNLEGTYYVIPEGTQEIRDSAFRNVRWTDMGISAFTIPSSVTKIGNYAFAQDYNQYAGVVVQSLSAVVLPDSITELGESAFKSNHYLTDVGLPDSLTVMGKGIFNDCRILTGVTFPSGITAIPDGMFTQTGFKEIEIPDTVEKIGNGAFSLCYYLTDVSLPDSCKILDVGAFRNALLTAISLNQVEIISGAALSATKLLKLTFPETVQSIGSLAGPVLNGNIPTFVVMESETPPRLYNNRTFSNVNYPIYVPPQSVETYKTASAWSAYSDYIIANPVLEPLTFELSADTQYGTFGLRNYGGGKPITLQYQRNDSEWYTTAITSHFFINVAAGDTLRFKCDDFQSADDTGLKGWYFSADSHFTYKVHGNIMSLIDSTGYTTATTLSDIWAFRGLFADCGGLLSAKHLALPATTLSKGCYSMMFENCTAMTEGPILLDARELTENCYENMFYGCSSLIKAPVLPAPVLVPNCYFAMFADCESLNYILCLAQDISATDSTTAWVQNVAPTGTLITPPSAYYWTRGENGLPVGWERRDY